MSAMKDGTLHVPGAGIYYTVRGSRPLLLVLQGYVINHLAGIPYPRWAPPPPAQG